MDVKILHQSMYWEIDEAVHLILVSSKVGEKWAVYKEN